MNKLKEFADKLNGRQYLNELTKELEAYAKENGIVIVYGQSDDLMEVRGAIDEEFGCYDGREFTIDDYGNVYGEENGVVPAHRHYLNAIWCPKGTDYSWGYETNIPHETFTIMEEDEPYCKGIVFYLKDLKPKKTNFDRITQSVESLAETVCESGLCPFEYSVGVDCHKDGCKECIKGWLQKECEQ